MNRSHFGSLDAFLKQFLLTRKTETGAVDGVAKGSIFAGAQLTAFIAKSVSGTGSGTRLSIPTGFANTITRPRMAPGWKARIEIKFRARLVTFPVGWEPEVCLQLGCGGFTWANLRTARAVKSIWTGSLTAKLAGPSFCASAGSVFDGADGSVLALALVVTVFAPESRRTLLLTLKYDVTRLVESGK